MGEWFLFQKINFFNLTNNIKGLSNSLFQINENLLLQQNNEGVSLFEKLINKDFSNNSCERIMAISCLFKKDFSKYLNVPLSNGFLFKEEIFFNPKAFYVLKFLLDQNYINFNEKINYVYEDENENKEVTIETTGLFLSILNNNILALQYADENHNYAFKFIDNFKRTFLSYTLLNTEVHDLILNIVIKHSTPQILDVDGYDPIEYCLHSFKKEFHQYDQQEKQKISLNVHKAIRAYKYNIANSIYSKRPNILVQSILENDQKFIDYLFNHLLFVNLNAQDRFGFAPIDYISKTYNKDLLKIFSNYEKKYCENYLLYKRKNYFHLDEMYHINFLSAPFMIQFKNEKFNVNHYLNFFCHCINEYKIPLDFTNQYGNTFLHMICHYMSKNFESYFQIFKFFIQKCKMNPLILNDSQQSPISLISDQKHKTLVIAYLKTQNINYVESHVKHFEDYKNEIKQKMDLANKENKQNIITLDLTKELELNPINLEQEAMDFNEEKMLEFNFEE